MHLSDVPLTSKRSAGTSDTPGRSSRLAAVISNAYSQGFDDLAVGKGVAAIGLDQHIQLARQRHQVGDMSGNDATNAPMPGLRLAISETAAMIAPEINALITT